MPTKVTSSLINTISAAQVSTTVKNITGTTYTLQGSDMGSILRYDSSVDMTLTIPASIGNVGDQVLLLQVGAGNIITAAGAGVVRLAAGAATQTFDQYSVAALIETANNEWLLVGDIA
jgi:hypothetical protein